MIRWLCLPQVLRPKRQLQSGKLKILSVPMMLRLVVKSKFRRELEPSLAPDLEKDSGPLGFQTPSRQLSLATTDCFLVKLQSQDNALFAYCGVLIQDLGPSQGTMGVLDGCNEEGSAMDGTMY